MAFNGSLVEPVLYLTSMFKTKEFKECTGSLAEGQESSTSIKSTPHWSKDGRDFWKVSIAGFCSGRYGYPKVTEIEEGNDTLYWRIYMEA